ncbi:response regulator [Candidatus Kaiserbacteria bacterium]|nr:response regulator [Candidatus Kaiserbacteria bacterium]
MRRILMLEDSATDAELIERKLSESGLVFTGRRVSSKSGFLQAIKDKDEAPDIILADYTLPSFLGSEALAFAKEYCPDTPFIFVTGTMGEERAIEALKSGATDYVLKERLFRLPGVVNRALEEVQERKRLKLVEAREKEAEHEIFEANRAKDDFLALLSHELRNPLVPLLINAEQIAGETEDPATQERAQAIYRQAYHMSKLLDDLLDVTRITQGKITLKKQPVNLKRIVEEAVEMVRPLADEREHTIVAEHVEALRLNADPVRLEQILVNLLNNAVKYTDKGGLIEIMAHREDDNVVITVKDTGVGITLDLLPRVFDLFVRGGHSLARTSSGLGIGLTLVKRLVELHGGVVYATSEGPNRGSTFSVRLPIGNEERDVAHKSRSLSRNAAQGTPHRNVLVVDDNRDLTDALGSALRAAGHTVHVAYDGKEAIRIAEKTQPQVVLLDIGLPDMDGLSVARTLRRQFGRSMELIALSGYGQEKDKQKAYKAGFDRYIVKPIGVKELQEIV